MSKYHTLLLPNEIYHVFNRAIGNEQHFVIEDNYRYFLTKLAHHVLPIADVFTYSLMPNHFHLLIEVKDEETITAYYNLKKTKPFNPTTSSLPDFVMEQFSNWLNGYTKAYNKMYNRKGALFLDYLKRSIVSKDSDFTSFVFYLHKNAVHHGICKKLANGNMMDTNLY
ncbi:MAG: hypothetical protein WDM90_19495 [Ferruginibacter sp.]